MIPSFRVAVGCGLLASAVALGQDLVVPPKPMVKFDPLARAREQKQILTDARDHLAKGRYKEALHTYTRWDPDSWCGTCHSMMLGERLYHIALCHAFLGDSVGAARVCLDGFCAPFMEWSDTRVGLFVYDLYRAAGQLDDLWRLLADADQFVLDEVTKGWPMTIFEWHRHRQSLPSAVAWRLRKIDELAEDQDIAGLIANCQDAGYAHSDTTGPERSSLRFAAEALAGCGKAATGSIGEAIFARQKNVSWLIYALGKSTDPDALVLLKAVAKVETSWNGDNVAYALALRGEAGRTALREVADRDTNGMQVSALKWLKTPPAEPVRPPQPKPGTLPTSLPR